MYFISFLGGAYLFNTKGKWRGCLSHREHKTHQIAPVNFTIERESVFLSGVLWIFLVRAYLFNTLQITGASGVAALQTWVMRWMGGGGDLFGSNTGETRGTRQTKHGMKNVDITFWVCG